MSDEHYDEEIIDKIIEELAPNLIAEEPTFLLPDNDLAVETIQRPNLVTLPEHVFASGPLFLSTCYDEFSRKYIVTSTAKECADALELDKSIPDLAEDESSLVTHPQSVLKFYSPNLQCWYSTHRKVPRDLRPILSGEVAADSNILIRINLSEIKVKPCFEPVFVSACLFALVGDELHRLSESFSFDLTPPDIRKQFPFVYNSISKTGEEKRQFDDNVFMYMAMLPEELKNLPVYLVMQLNKVLSTDAEKAVAPYFPKAQIPEIKKHMVSTERLTRYRQPVGIGVVKLERDKMRIGAQINVTIPTFCLRTCCNDTGISQIIKELFPGPDAVTKSILYSDSSKFRPEELDLKLKLSFFNLGTTDQSMDRIREVSIVTGTSTEKRTTKLQPFFIDPQVFGDTSAAKRVSASRHCVTGNQQISPVKKLLPLIPPTLPGSQEVVRQLRNAFDNTMFVYVSQFDKMPSSARNLSAKIELVEIKGTIYERRMPLPSASQITLQNIYDPLSPFGHEFVSESFSRVSYHVRNPSICDEMKIKLPEVLTARHWLKFTILHVHVKPQTNRGSILSNIIRSSIDKDMLSECDVVGVGYLPLLVNGENLLEDSEHLVGLFSLEHTKHPDFSVNNGMFVGIPSKDGSDCPVLRVRTRAFSSFTSGSRQIQSLFRASPLPLGVLSSSSLAPSQQVRIFQRASKLSLQETKLISCLQELHNASVVELSRHFLVITRLLVRAMLGGTGSYDENYANPFMHVNGRCNAFWTFMRVLSKVFGEYNITNSSETNVNKDVFDAFIEYVLDEEVPIDAATMELIEEELEKAAAAQEKEQIAAAAVAAEVITMGKVDASAASDESASLSPRYEPTPNSNYISEKFASVDTSDSSGTLPVTPAAPLPTAKATVAPAVMGVPHVSSEDNEDAYSVSDDGGEHCSDIPRAASNPPSIIQIPHLRESSENFLATSEVLSAEDVNVGISLVSDDLKGSGNESDSRVKMVYNEYNQTIDENEVEILQPLSSTSKTSTSLERKSWGKYLSDSMWQSGRFLPISGFRNDPLSRATESDALLNGMPSKEETTEKYLDDIALHITQQIERIISEHLISLAVIETSSSIDVDASDIPMFDDDTESSALLSGKIDVDALLAGKRYRFSYRPDSKRRDLPFHVEHGWFEPIDNGTIIDDEEVLLNEDVARQRLATKLSRSQVSTRNHLTIASSNQFFDILDGFKDRKESVLRGPEFSSFVTHWWPWLYEVIIYQWVAALAMILSAAGKVNSNTIESMVVAYPFELKVDKDLRAIMLEKSPVLLRVILKSLTFRIKFEGMTPPVLMDEQCFSALENLVIMLALQSFDLMAGLWLARDTIRMVSSFLRSLFAILAPGQVIKLIQSFFKVGKMKSKTEELELRLLAAEELSYFDHFIAANFPLALDAPSSLFLSIVLDNWNAAEMNSLTAYTASGIRYSSCPSPYTFVQLLLSELVVATRPECPRRELAWRILRDLIARHASDSRYQSAEAQQRIACMYLPLLGEILYSAEYLASLRYDVVERKEALAIFLYLVNALPERLFRQKLRELCLAPQRTTFSRSNSLFSPMNAGDLSSPESSVGGKTPRVISLKATKAHGKLSDIDGFISQSEKRANSLYAMCMLFHMVLDTFEAPSPELCRDGANSVLSDKATENLGHVLAPTCSINASIASTSAAGGSSSTNSSSASNGAFSSSVASEVTARNSILSENVPTTRGSIDPKDALDAHMQSKKTAISSAKSTISTDSKPSSSSTSSTLSLSTNTDLGSVVGGGGSMAISPTAASANSGGQRRWAEKKQKLPGASTAGGDGIAGREKTIVWSILSREDAATAVKNLSITSVRTVLRCLWLMYDECPSALDQVVKNGEQNDTFVARDTNLDESMLNGVSNFKIVPFLRMALTVLLHALYANQDRSDLANIFLCADTAIRRFGARLFILALEDSLQYWMHVCMFHAASPYREVRQHVCNFLLCFLRSSYHYFGTFNLISNTILAIFNDVQYDILENHRHEIAAPSDVDKLLSRLGESIQQMRQAARDKIARGEAHPKRKRYPFCSSLIAFMNSLEMILLASADLRRYVNHPVLYDYYGGNMLDGPFDERVGILMQSIRNRRKAVKAEGGMDQQQGGVRSGFHIEEIMTKFLQAAEVYDPMILPRFRMQWLENLARLHDLRQNRAEGAEVRWLIFKLCQRVEATWQQLWVPKPPLDWLRRGMSPVETGLGHLSAMMSMMTTTSVAGGGGLGVGAFGGGGGAIATNAPAGSGAASNASTPHTTSSNTTSADRNFYQVLTRALDAQMFRPWVDANQYWQHMEMALSIATDRYCTANLVHLAERSSSHLISLYRLTKKTEKMMAEYLRIANTIKAVQDKGITTDIAIGTFYRVLYTGEGIPLHLRDKEFIFRNATHLHVSEFHALVMNHVKSIVAEGVEIKMVKDAIASLDASPTSATTPTAAPLVTGANIVMNSVKLCMAQQSKHNPCKLLGGKRHLSRMNNTEDLHQVTMFQYSVPFTLESGRSHAKKIDDQWMRTTTLHVREPFPYALTRQLVVKRDVRIMSPIEVATQDIQDRVESMEVEIDSGVKTTNDTNNLMRLVQGTVRPQVNAGAGEVAKVFLSSHKILSEETQWQMKWTELQEKYPPSSGSAMNGDENQAKKRLASQTLLEEKRRNEELVTTLKVYIYIYIHGH
jgi:hypothetical protein